MDGIPYLHQTKEDQLAFSPYDDNDDYKDKAKKTVRFGGKIC
jgi:hypothetical protein